MGNRSLGLIPGVFQINPLQHRLCMNFALFLKIAISIMAFFVKIFKNHKQGEFVKILEFILVITLCRVSTRRRRVCKLTLWGQESRRKQRDVTQIFWDIINSNLANSMNKVIFWGKSGNMVKQLILVLSWHHKIFLKT